GRRGNQTGGDESDVLARGFDGFRQHVIITDCARPLPPDVQALKVFTPAGHRAAPGESRLFAEQLYYTRGAHREQQRPETGALFVSRQVPAEATRRADAFIG